MGTVFRTGAEAGEIPVNIGPDGAGRGFRYCSGAASNFRAHPAQQKKYVRPPCSDLARAEAGSTCMPQTGSRSITSCSAIFPQPSGPLTTEREYRSEEHTSELQSLRHL